MSRLFGTFVPLAVSSLIACTATFESKDKLDSGAAGLDGSRAMGEDDCGGADLSADTSNCGVCGFACDAWETCRDGACTVDCDADLDVDTMNCGACGRACAADQVCMDGQCKTPKVDGVVCADGETACGVSCIPAGACCDDSSCADAGSATPYCSARECVACRGNTDCASDEICSNGTCESKAVACADGCEAEDAGTGGVDSGAEDEDPCPEGMVRQDGECENVNECFEGTHACHLSSTCRDLDPGYTCDCEEGYAGGGPGGAACASRVSAGGNTACEVNASGAVYCWGENVEGQLGDGTRQSRTVLTRVNGLAEAASIVAGGTTTCAVLRDGGVSCWGQLAGNEWGQGSLEPVSLAGLDEIIQLSLGAAGTGCAVDRAGAVFCWGENGKGQTGTGEATGIPLSRPVRVEGLEAVRRVDVGLEVACATSRNGAAFCWGEGLLTGPTATSSAVPVKVPFLDDAVRVVTGFQRVCALRYNGYLTCWGTPNLIDGGDTNDPGPRDVAYHPRVEAFAMGLYHTCFLQSGQLRCWDAGTSYERVDASEIFVSVDTNPFAENVAALTPDGRVRVWDLYSGAPELTDLSVDTLP